MSDHINAKDMMAISAAIEDKMVVLVNDKNEVIDPDQPQLDSDTDSADDLLTKELDKGKGKATDGKTQVDDHDDEQSSSSDRDTLSDPSMDFSDTDSHNGSGSNTGSVAMSRFLLDVEQGVTYQLIDDGVDTSRPMVSLSTMIGVKETMTTFIEQIEKGVTALEGIVADGRSRGEITAAITAEILDQANMIKDMVREVKGYFIVEYEDVTTDHAIIRDDGAFEPHDDGAFEPGDESYNSLPEVEEVETIEDGFVKLAIEDKKE
ncbi:hypothetical protein DFH27DRAFT_609725 [Peziza echinospora]|nr:hypothetical protein DFH27DRAFT_609725 [Peziza echinospora]